MRFSKVFGVGLPRTGTTSLFQALNQINVPCIHFPFTLYREGIRAPLLERYTAFVDTPIPLLYQELDAAYPGSGFILTKRPLDDWMRSMEWLLTEGRQVWAWKPEYDAYHQKFFGACVFDSMLYREKYETFHRTVVDYFSERDNLLVLDLAKGYGYRELCQFLDVPLSTAPYPRGNSSREARSLQKLASRVRRVHPALEIPIRRLDHSVNRLRSFI
ncbi:MAG: sulfotransferase family protein [Cyanobacteria bacterium J06614_10]